MSAAASARQGARKGATLGTARAMPVRRKAQSNRQQFRQVPRVGPASNGPAPPWPCKRPFLAHPLPRLPPYGLQSCKVGKLGTQHPHASRPHPLPTAYPSPTTTYSSPATSHHPLITNHQPLIITDHDTPAHRKLSRQGRYATAHASNPHPRASNPHPQQPTPTPPRSGAIGARRRTQRGGCGWFRSPAPRRMASR